MVEDQGTSARGGPTLVTTRGQCCFGLRTGWLGDDGEEKKMAISASCSLFMLSARAEGPSSCSPFMPSSPSLQGQRNTP
jgi:hypothetical protein